MKPTPDNVKEILNQLAGPQQVVLRTYIASLRSEIKDLEEQVMAQKDPDPHAHYHGHEKCTADHSHEHDHHKGHDHKEHDHEGHDHKEHDHKGHDHKGHDHKEHEHGHDHSTCTEDHEHSHEHEKHDHDHKHGHEHHKKSDDDMPAWKKKALESGTTDATAAPFGGNWNTESSLSATDKMEE